MSEYKDMNVIQKMNSIAFEMPMIPKNMRVGKGDNSYLAVSEGNVLSAVKPLEKKYGVYSLPIQNKVIAQEIVRGENKYGESIKYFLRVEVTARFYNEDNIAEFVEVVAHGDGNDSLDKAPGKALTYAFKNALCKAYKIESGDDPDKDHSDEVIAREKKEKEEMEKRIKADKEKKEKAEKVAKEAEAKKPKLEEEAYKKYLEHTVVKDIENCIIKLKMTDDQKAKLQERIKELKTPVVEKEEKSSSGYDDLI